MFRLSGRFGCGALLMGRANLTLFGSGAGALAHRKRGGHDTAATIGDQPECAAAVGATTPDRGDESRRERGPPSPFELAVRRARSGDHDNNNSISARSSSTTTFTPSATVPRTSFTMRAGDFIANVPMTTRRHRDSAAAAQLRR